MLLIINRLFGSDAGLSKAPIDDGELPFLQFDELKLFMDSFPIGSRIFYYPEHRKDMRLETLVIGYRINGLQVYSLSNIDIDNDSAVITAEDGTKTTIKKISQFYFVVPHQRRSVVDLGVNWWEQDPSDTSDAEINDFAIGNTISLFSYNEGSGVPTLETYVARSAEMPSGMYAKTRVVLLEPDPDNFRLMDRRNDKRIPTDIPVLAKTSSDGPTVQAVLDEFSEGYVRLCPVEGDEVLPSVVVGRRVVFAIESPMHKKRFVLRCALYRRVGVHLILNIDAKLKDDRFVHLEHIDMLEIKAMLLNHPATLEKSKKT
jgi:hypothetical protein